MPQLVVHLVREIVKSRFFSSMIASFIINVVNSLLRLSIVSERTTGKAAKINETWITFIANVWTQRRIHNTVMLANN